MLMVSSAFRICGSSPSNCTSTTAPMTCATLPVAGLDAWPSSAWAVAFFGAALTGADFTAAGAASALTARALPPLYGGFARALQLPLRALPWPLGLGGLSAGFAAFAQAGGLAASLASSC